VDVEDVLLGNSDTLFTALLHCNANNLAFEILKNDKMWGTICISIPTPNFGGLVPPCPVIYAHGSTENKTMEVFSLIFVAAVSYFCHN